MSSVGGLKPHLQYKDNNTGLNCRCVPKVIEMIDGKCPEHPSSIKYVLSTTPFSAQFKDVTLLRAAPLEFLSFSTETFSAETEPKTFIL